MAKAALQPKAKALPEPPDVRSLAAALREVLRDPGVKVLSRRPNVQVSTFPSEVVTCRSGGRELRLFCKYAWPAVRNVYGHRGGVALEAAVYERVLEPLRGALPAARLFGSYVNPETADVWLFVEELGDAPRVNKSPDPRAVERAAEWIGSFHARNLTRVAELKDLLPRYDEPYYLGWARRTREFAGDVAREASWLAALSERFHRVLPLLLNAEETVIHGEYYPANVLVRGGRVFPVDWESAAVATGEIDLASLTEKWPAETAQRCEAVYRAARWQGQPPDRFPHGLDAARLYLHFRWLGNRPQWTADAKRHKWRFEHLRELGEKMGVI
jgi:hypothetical protein